MLLHTRDSPTSAMRSRNHRVRARAWSLPEGYSFDRDERDPVHYQDRVESRHLAGGGRSGWRQSQKRVWSMTEYVRGAPSISVLA